MTSVNKLLLHATIHAKLLMPFLASSNFAEHISTSIEFNFEFLYSFGLSHARKIETKMILPAFNNIMNKQFTTKSMDDRPHSK